MFIFRGAHVGQQRLFWRFVHHLPNCASLLDSLLNMQLAHDGIPSQDRLLLTRFFWEGLLADPLQHARWLSPTPSHNFRGTFAKISLFTDPGHQQGVHWRKADARGLGVWLSQSLTFGNLAAAFGARFLRLQKSIIRQRQRQVQGCASGPWCLAVAELLCFWCCQVWKMKKSRRIASFLTLLSSKMKEVSQNCFVFDVVNFKKGGGLAELLSVWCGQRHKMRKSRRSAAFLMLSTWKNEEVS